MKFHPSALSLLRVKTPPLVLIRSYPHRSHTSFLSRMDLPPWLDYFALICILGGWVSLWRLGPLFLHRFNFTFLLILCLMTAQPVWLERNRGFQVSSYIYILCSEAMKLSEYINRMAGVSKLCQQETILGRNHMIH